MRLDPFSVLVVDSDRSSLAMLSHLLRAIGVGAIPAATDADMALAALRTQNVDVVITNLGSEGQDLAFVRALRASAEMANSGAPVIMLTGHSGRTGVVEARAAGVNGFLGKPVTTKALMRRLIELICASKPIVRTYTYFGADRRRPTSRTYLGPFRRYEERVRRDAELRARGLAV